MKNFAFTSFVGHQIFSVINALDAIMNNLGSEESVSEIILYASKDIVYGDRVSKGSISEAMKIDEYAKRKNYPRVTIIEYDRKQNLCDSFVKAVTDRGMRIIFNIEGGMNYNIAQYVLAMKESAPDSEVITTDGSYCRRESLSQVESSPYWMAQGYLIPPVSLYDIFALQEIKYTTCEIESDFSLFIRNNCKSIPPSAVFNIVVDNILFDVVWNCGGNHLAFLLSPYSTSNPSVPKGKRNNAVLARIRKLTVWASSKSQDKKYYDYHVYVLCEKRDHIETAKQESRNKLLPIEDVAGFFENRRLMLHDKEGSFPAVQGDVKELIFNIDQIFSDIAEYKETGINDKLRNKIKLCDNSLIVIMGADPASTVSAIISHITSHPWIETVFCLCTSDLAERTINHTRRLKSYSKLKKISFRIILTDIKGRSIPYRFETDDNYKNIEVNVTPGTKSQTAFLSAFASTCGYSVWTINNNICTCLNKDLDDIPVTNLNPEELLDHEKYTIIKENRQNDSLIMTLIKRGITGLRRGNSSLEQNFSELGVTVVQIPKETEKRLSGGSLNYSAVKLGTWFEEFTNIAFSRIQDSRTSLNVKVMRNNYQGHITEIDSLISYRNMIVVVSCKAYYDTDNAQDLKEKLQAPITESVAFAKSVSRFALPVICVLDKFDMAPLYQTNSGTVAIIDMKDMCNNKELARLLDKLEDSYLYENKGAE
ncbi:MAG: hypothetical protein ACI4NE_07470 [Succinivibrio sp.]